MPTSAPLVDIEAVLIAYCLADSRLDGIPTRREPDEDFPETGEALACLTRATATAVDPGTNWIERPVIDWKAYGSSRDEAWAVAAALHWTLTTADQATHDGAVITAVETTSGPTWSEDPETGAPRFIGTVAVTVHPA